MKILFYTFAFLVALVLIYAAFFHKKDTMPAETYVPEVKNYVPDLNDPRNFKPGKG